MAGRGWMIAYVASWAATLAPVGALVGQVLLKYQDVQDGTDMWWAVGACAGGVSGLVLAWGTRTAAPLHGFLRGMAPIVTLGGVVLAVWMFVAAAQVRGREMFSGVGEFVLGLLGVLIAWSGAALWLAAIAGHRARSRSPG